ncbi:hypothetical protein KUTeg_001933 [Tegillarca granosa]|uniref:Uncharacterized protein n=1 Tax=Tegillarca granosa TaxID=220873 RepID=A0ABQ9FSW1_TEGGR|nr:hypothetical protein KUTeg_001933 [Tegillarca granosa]
MEKGTKTYPACEYYRDPMGYYQKIEKLLQEKKAKQTGKTNTQDPTNPDVNAQNTNTNAKTPDPFVTGNDVKSPI